MCQQCIYTHRGARKKRSSGVRQRYAVHHLLIKSRSGERETREKANTRTCYFRASREKKGKREREIQTHAQSNEFPESRKLARRALNPLIVKSLWRDNDDGGDDDEEEEGRREVLLIKSASFARLRRSPVVNTERPPNADLRDSVIKRKKKTGASTLSLLLFSFYIAFRSCACVAGRCKHARIACGGIDDLSPPSVRSLCRVCAGLRRPIWRNARESFEIDAGGARRI